MTHLNSTSWQAFKLFMMKSYWLDMLFFSTYTGKFSSQQVWRVATEILHQHPNSTMEDNNKVYELMKLSVVKDYITVSLLAGALTAPGVLTMTLVLVGSSRCVWNIPITSCFVAT